MVVLTVLLINGNWLDEVILKVFCGLWLQNDDEKLCNCRQRENNPTDGKCLTKRIVCQYKTEVSPRDDINAKQTYLGVIANDFKT